MSNPPSVSVPLFDYLRCLKSDVDAVKSRSGLNSIQHCWTSPPWTVHNPPEHPYNPPEHHITSLNLIQKPRVWHVSRPRQPFWIKQAVRSVFPKRSTKEALVPHCGLFWYLRPHLVRIGPKKWAFSHPFIMKYADINARKPIYHIISKYLFIGTPSSWQLTRQLQ